MNPSLAKRRASAWTSMTVVATVAGIGLSHSLRAQSATVAGVVVERSFAKAIPRARVRLSGSVPVVADSAGRFQILDASAGPHILTVEAIGYQFRSIEVIVRADTMLRIDMDRRAVVLDPMLIRAGLITIKGSIRDSVTGMNLMQAHVTMYPGARTEGASSGRFVLDSVPKGEAVSLVFEALEHLPVRIDLVPAGDTSLTVHLAVDSVGVRIIAQQAKRLATRAMAVPFAIDALNRDRIRDLQPASIGELVQRRLPGLISNRWPYFTGNCVFYDDIPVRFDVVFNMVPEMIERVEIYGRATMIRVYSKQYVSTLIREKTLPRVFC